MEPPIYFDFDLCFEKSGMHRTGGAMPSARKFLDSEDGATAIEYALIASLISMFIIGALLLFQGAVSDMFGYISTTLISTGAAL